MIYDQLVDTVSEWGTASAVSFVLLLLLPKVVDWPKLGCGLKILWLFNYPAGGAKR